MRRKVERAQLIRESNSNPGYFKYEITIRNKDNSIETIPTYGKDLQSALKRLLHDEFAYRAIEFINTHSWMWLIVGVLWMLYELGLGLIYMNLWHTVWVFIIGTTVPIIGFLYLVYRLSIQNDSTIDS